MDDGQGFDPGSWGTAPGSRAWPTAWPPWEALWTSAPPRAAARRCRAASRSVPTDGSRRPHDDGHATEHVPRSAPGVPDRRLAPGDRDAQVQAVFRVGVPPHGRPDRSDPSVPRARRVRRRRVDRSVLDRPRAPADVDQRVPRPRRAGARVRDRRADGGRPPFRVLLQRAGRCGPARGPPPRSALAVPAPRPAEHRVADLRADRDGSRVDLRGPAGRVTARAGKRSARRVPPLVRHRRGRPRDRGRRDRHVAPRPGLDRSPRRSRLRPRSCSACRDSRSHLPGAPPVGWSWVAVAAGVGFLLLSRIEAAREPDAA